MLLPALAVYGLMSLVTVIAYAFDKRAARRGTARTPEATLHILELLGGWPGALIAQWLIRHKNAKVTYQIVFWLIGLGHMAAWVLVTTR